MATYVASAEFNGELVHSEQCKNERDKLVTALAAHNDYMYLTLYVTGLGAGVANTTIQDAVMIPEACTLVAVMATCTTQTGTGAPTVDIFEEDAGTPATILDAPITMAAKTQVAGVIATGDTARVAGDTLGLRCVTAGDGTLTVCCVTLTLKKTLTT